MPDRRLAVMGARFDPSKWRNDLLEAIEGAVRAVALKALESAVEDAPVRDVFKHGAAYRRRGLRTRRLTQEEIEEEEGIRRTLAFRSGRDYREAVPGMRTRGRRDTNNPYLRRAATRSGNPNSFAPFLLAPAGIDEDGERVPARYGGREVAGGKLINFPDAADPRRTTHRVRTVAGRIITAPRDSDYGHSPLHSRGRYELRSGRANAQALKMVGGRLQRVGEVTLGGRLRREIRLQGPYRIGSVIKARVLSPTPYAQYQEFGTRHNRATPYMRPAILKLVTSYRRDMVKAINRIHRAT